MDTFDRKKKEAKLKRNIDVSLEREVRQIQQREHRTIRSEERKQMRKKWEKGAERIDKNMLSSVWNPKTDEDKPGPMKGYFGGVSFDRQGRIVR